MEFNVVCRTCGDVWSPGLRSPLWWRAKKRADDGYLDALSVSGEECGCVKKSEKPVKPDAPYRVFGYDDMCVDFNIPFTSFVEAAREYRSAAQQLCTVFISGVSPAVERRLRSY